MDNSKVTSDILEQLHMPFPGPDIEWRVQRSGFKDGKPWAMVLAYVTSRAIQDRLDSVIGAENWQNRFDSLADGGIICGIGIRIDGDWIWKYDGADKTNIEATKGGLSGAMKRAGVQWGIGRYLYNLPRGFAVFNENGIFRGAIKKSKDDRNPQWLRWNPPSLPSWALPEGSVVQPDPSEDGRQSEPSPNDKTEQNGSDTPAYSMAVKDVLKTMGATLTMARDKEKLISDKEFDDWKTRLFESVNSESACSRVAQQIEELLEQRRGDATG